MNKAIVALVSSLLVLSPLALAAAAPSADAEKWAVVIGISDYAGATVSTPGSAGDAAKVREAMVGNGWPEANIRTLVDGEATEGAIREAMDWLVDNSSDTSFSVFAYSGHVKQMSGDQDGDGEDNDEFLWPHDNNFISDGDFAERMRAIRGDAWINIAGCEAAGFDDGASGPRKLFTAASQEVEKGYERADWQMSVFNGLMVDQAMLQGRGDVDGNGAVSIQEAFDIAAAEAPVMTEGQRYGPQHPYIAGGDGPQWFLSPPPPPPAAAAVEDGESGLLGGSGLLGDDLLGGGLGEDLLGGGLLGEDLPTDELLGADPLAGLLG